MRRFTLICILLSVLASPLMAAQPQRGGALDPAKAADPRRVPQLQLTLPERADLAREDAERDAAGEPFRFALPEEVALTPDNAGTWEDLPGGRRIWRQRVTVPGALSLSLGFVRYGLPASGRLALYPAANPGRGHVFDAGDNAAHGQLWTPVLLTDDLVIELVVDAAERHLVDLELGVVGRGYRYFGEDVAEKSGACNVPVVCPVGDPWREEIDAVGVYQIGASWKCTGAMINNTDQDGRPLFLTASHCDVYANLAPSVVVYWNFQSPTCDPRSPGSLDDSQSGSALLARWGGDGTSDVCLLELEDMPAPSYGVTYAGWSREDVAPPRAVAIHHPQTDEKSISFEDDPLTVTSYDSDVSPGDGTHLRVADWDLGTTEIGSSGSPLFDANHRIVGQLHGGYAGCGNDLPDWYGRITTSWDGGGTADTRLRDWLDPQGSGVPYLDALDLEEASISVTPTSGLEFSGPVGGPFLPASGSYMVLADGSMAVAYEVTTTAGWLDADPAEGTLAPGAQAQVTVELDGSATGLGEGRHTAQVDFVNVTGGPGGVGIPVVLDVYSISPRITNLIPNPAWGPVDIEFTVGRAMDVRIRFYDVRGMLAADMGLFSANEGVNIYPWTGRDEDGFAFPGGVYIVEIEGNGHKERRKLVQSD